MVDVVFDLNQAITVIQAKLDEPFQVVIDKFIQKTLIDPNSVYYIANAKPINPQQTVENQMSDLNKQNKKLIILVNSIDKDDQDKEKIIIQSKDIICPNCKEPCRYKLENYINGKDSSQNYNLFLLVFLIIFLSPFILRRRYQKCNLIIKIAILFATIYPLILPIHFFENINGKIGFVINAFTIVGSSIRYEHWCIQMAYMFYISVIFPYIIYLSGYSYHKRSKKLKYINFTITSIIFIISFYIHIYAMAQSISILFLLLSGFNL